MLSFLYKFVSPWAISNKLQIVGNRFMGVIANFLYKRLCSTLREYENNVANGVIVTLTTYPGRINEVYYCLQSLLHQRLQPEKTILWLAREQFPNGIKDVPQRIFDLQDKGLSIEFCDDYRSYKKIVEAAKKWSNYSLVTADDDTLYPEDWLENLVETWKANSKCVVCYRAHKITIRDNAVEPYSNWQGLSKNIKGPLISLIPIGVGGVLYPPHYFSGVEFNYEEIKNLAPTTDDIWLKVVGLTKQIKVVKVFENSKEWFTVKGSQTSSLVKHNVEQTNANDTALRNLMEYYGIGIECFKE